jgi:hypothetical protein
MITLEASHVFPLATSWKTFLGRTRIGDNTKEFLSIPTASPAATIDCYLLSLPGVSGMLVSSVLFYLAGFSFDEVRLLTFSLVSYLSNP